VSELWAAGLYPFGPPFVYPVEGRHYVTFPPAFAVISTPFYAASGFRGLYAIPLLGTWALWWCFHRATRRLALGSLATGLALTGLIFASPLTMYSATFWKHTLCVALAFVDAPAGAIGADLSPGPADSSSAPATGSPRYR